MLPNFHPVSLIDAAGATGDAEPILWVDRAHVKAKIAVQFLCDVAVAYADVAETLAERDDLTAAKVAAEAAYSAFSACDNAAHAAAAACGAYLESEDLPYREAAYQAYHRAKSAARLET